MTQLVRTIKVEPALKDPVNDVHVRVGRHSIVLPRTLLPTLTARLSAYLETEVTT